MDMSIGISSIENNVLQSFFVFFRMVITNKIICNIKITIYIISKNSAITISSIKFKFHFLLHHAHLLHSTYIFVKILKKADC